MREVAFPEIKSFGDVFTSWSYAKTIAPLAWRAEESYFPKRKGAAMRKRAVTVEVGPYCSVHDAQGYRTIYVTPAPRIADHVRRQWVSTTGGSWQVTVRDDGTALITAQYSQIIGSVWIALVDARTIPPAQPTPKDPPPVYELDGVHTRAAYMDGKVDFHTYYAQFVTGGVTDLVSKRIGLDAIRKSIDPHLNDIPLGKWDALQYEVHHAADNTRLRLAGETWSLGTAVCILKTAARILAKGGAL